MRWKFFLIVTLIAVVVSAFFYLDTFVWSNSYSGNVLYVDNDWIDSEEVPSELSFGINAFHSIENAVMKADSQENNEIVVMPGDYSIGEDPLEIEKPNLVIRSSEGAEETIIESEGHVLSIRAENVALRGFTVSGPFEKFSTGIYVFGNDCKISGTIVENKNIGITITAEDRERPASGVILEGNTFKDDSWGVTLGWSEDCSILNNRFDNCFLDTITRESEPRDYCTHTIKNNTINGDPILYCQGMSDETITTQARELIIADCSNLKIGEANNLEHVRIGYSDKIEISGLKKLRKITMQATENSIVRKNRITGLKHWGGIVLSNSDSNLIENNTIENLHVGISLYFSINNTISNNTLSEIGFDAIRMEEGSSYVSNTVKNNQIVKK